MRKKIFAVGMVVLLLLAAVVVILPSVMAQTSGVTRDLPSGTQTAGSEITVSLNVIVGSATFYIIDEQVPTGWTVTNASGGGDFAAEPGHVKWVIISGATDISYTYTVTIPGDAAGDYTFTGTYMMEGMTSEANIGGDTNMMVVSGSSSTPSPTVSIDPASTTVSPGDTFAVDVIVDSGTYNLTGCKIDLVYNSSALEATNITEGTLLDSPALVEPGSGITDGLIHYGMSRATGEGNIPAPASGTFITIEFEVKEGASADTYTLDLQNVELDDENNQSIPGVGMNDGRVVVSGPILSPTPSAEETPTPTVSPIATPTPTPTLTVPTATPTPTPEEPGFEAVFAIAGLLAIAYVVLRRERK